MSYDYALSQEYQMERLARTLYAEMKRGTFVTRDWNDLLEKEKNFYRYCAKQSRQLQRRIALHRDAKIRVVARV